MLLLITGPAQARETVTVPALDFANALIANQQLDAARHLDNDWCRIGPGYNQEVPYGLTLYLQPDFIAYGYHATDPLFCAERRDRLYRLQVSAYKRDWILFGFSPLLSYAYSKRTSNIDLYADDRHQLQIGLTACSSLAVLSR